MDRKTIYAFIIIFASIFFFQSNIWENFYYHILLNSPTPKEVYEKKQQDKKIKNEHKDTADYTQNKSQELAITKPLALENKSVFPSKAEQKNISLKPIIIETPLYICKINRKGALITSWKLKGYKSFISNINSNDAEMIPEQSAGVINLSLNNINFDSLMFSCIQMDTLDTVKTVSKTDSLILTLVCNLSSGGVIEKEFVFKGNDYRTGLTIRKRYIPSTKIVLGWLGGLNVIDGIASMQSGGAGGFEGYLFYGDAVEKADDFKDNTMEFNGNISWAALKEGYFGCAVFPDQPRDASVEFKQKIENKNTVQMSYTLEEDFDAQEIKYEFFAGPMKYSMIKSYGSKLEGTIFQGYSWFFKADVWFPYLCGLVLWLLNFFFGLFPDYGVSIVIITIILRIIMIPLTAKSQKSMLAMKELQPKMTEIRTRYKNDSGKMNSEIMKLYKKQGVSPVGAGCLPMLLQMPLFIALFVALRKAVELRGAPTFLIPWAHDLSKPDVLFNMPFAIPFYGTGVCVLPILMTIATFFQNKATMKDPNQKMMVYMMPLIFLFMFNSFPAGLNLYWTLSTIIGLGQQYFTEYKNKNKQAVVVLQKP